MNYKLKIENWKLKISAKQRGFTLVELLMVMAIATILMTAVIVKQKNWNDQLAVSTQAYEMALMFRQAQLYSLGVRKSPPPNGAEDSFNVGYGIYIQDTGLFPNTQYVLFVDRNQNFKMDGGAGGAETVEPINLKKGVVISKFCGKHVSGAERCAPDAGNIGFLYISFFRPDPKANMIFENTGHSTSLNISPPAKIYLKSPNGNCYYVKVEANGQISTGSVPVQSQCL